MAVQLLEDWLLKEQDKILTTYRELNQAPLKEPGLIFIGDSIVEYFPIHELLQSPKHMVCSTGSQTDFYEYNRPVWLCKRQPLRNACGC